ncbi:MAG: DMT family transporter [Marinifilaceae bacterium]
MKIKILAILACLLWGSAFAGAKIGMEYTTPLHLSGMRFTLAGLLLIPIVIAQKANWRADLKQWRYMLIFGFFQTFIQYGLFFIGLNNTPATAAAIIVGSGPLFVAVLAHFFMKNEPITTRKAIAIMLGIAGVIFISLSSDHSTTNASTFWIGVTLLLISNLNGAYTNIVVAKNKGRVSPVTLTAFANFSGGIMLYLVSFIVEQPVHTGYTMEFYMALLWLAFIPAAAFSIWYSLLHRPHVKVSELNVWKFVVPVSGAILSWILLPNETPNLYSIIGILIISSALIILQLPQRRKQDKEIKQAA